MLLCDGGSTPPPQSGVLIFGSDDFCCDSDTPVKLPSTNSANAYNF